MAPTCSGSNSTRACHDTPRSHQPPRAVTGLAAGAPLTASLLAVLALGSLVRIPFAPFVVLDWLIRVLPARVVNFGLDLTIRVLNGLGFNIAATAKTTQQVLAVALFFVAGLVIGLLFFVLTRTPGMFRVKLYGLGTGGTAVTGPYKEYRDIGPIQP